jgi:hypothetical protein
VSTIFKWFKRDFDQAGGVKPVLAKYAPPAAKPLLEKADSKITYKSYNWGLNDPGAARTQLQDQYHRFSSLMSLVARDLLIPIERCFGCEHF